ncbi:Translocase of chloroplast [Musa troglodytarum]|uniref:Translocase of chloroplast n=1 Tax=Musa troglodytarum TaxID=320322 RepID=A0A9E7HLU9_9LILI|nr:Translocase of chloroplast [Musa troglodytarum]
MENGADAAKEERTSGDVRMAAANGDSRGGFDGGVECDFQETEDGSKFFKEIEVFEEALEPPLQHFLPDSGVASGVEDGAATELGPSVESLDLQTVVHERELDEEEMIVKVLWSRGEEEEKLDTSTQLFQRHEQEDEKKEEQEEEKEDNFEEHVVVVSEEGTRTCDECDRVCSKAEGVQEPMSIQSNYPISSSEAAGGMGEVTNGSSFIVDDKELTVGDGIKEFAGNKFKFEEIERMKLDRPDDLPHEGPENGESLEMAITVQSVAVAEEPVKFQQLKENSAEPDDGFAPRNGHAPVKKEDGGCSSSISDDNKKNASPSPSPSIPNPENLGHPGFLSRPAGLGSSVPLLEPSARSVQQAKANGSAPRRLSQPSEEPPAADGEVNDETHEKLQMIRVKFLRLAHRLGQTPHNVVVAQVWPNNLRETQTDQVCSALIELVLWQSNLRLLVETLDFSCTIMVIGKTGVGKSATINSMLDEIKLPTDAFQMGTRKVQEVVGMVQGIKVRIIDTPGLVSSCSDQHRNEKILHSVKRFINKTPPDIVLYFDRLDMPSRDYGDGPLLQTITNIFGTSIWFNAIVILTHAASAPPEGPNGSPLSYEIGLMLFSKQLAAGDVRLMNPVSLVENHSACRMNRAGQRVLPNGQSRPQLKLPGEQFGDDDNLDEDVDGTSDSDEGSDYDELPPFKPLTRSQLAKLSKLQKKAYFEELDYRERLFYKKQLKEEKRRRKFAKKMADMAKDMPGGHGNGDMEEETSGPASVPVPMPDYVLPNSFDSDNPTHRYRFLDSSNQWLVRPVLDSLGWDHDIGYEGLNVERVFAIKDKIPMSVSGQLTKDKKECSLQMEVASSIKHSESKATSLCLDMQTVGKDIAYTLRGETSFRNIRCNNTAAGVSVTVLGDSVSAGLKFEDKLTISKRFRVLLTGGAMAGRGDVAYGGRLEATLRDKDYPIGRALSTLALSIVDWHGDLQLGCNLQSQLPLGRGTNVIGHANLSNKGTSQFGFRLNSSEHLQIALLAFVPILRNVNKILFGSSQFIKANNNTISISYSPCYWISCERRTRPTPLQNRIAPNPPSPAFKSLPPSSDPTQLTFTALRPIEPAAMDSRTSLLPLFLASLLLLLLSPPARATIVPGSIERTTKQQILASIAPHAAEAAVPFLTSPSGKYTASLVRRQTAPGAGGLGNDFCYIQVQDTGAERSMWESECGPVSSANTCAAVFTAYGLQVFDGSNPVWDTGAQSADNNFLETLELVDQGDMRIRDKYGELAWKASDDPRANQNCGLPGSPGMAPAAPPFAVPIGGDNQNLPFGQPASSVQQQLLPPQSNTMYDQEQPQHPFGGASQAFGFNGHPLVDNTPYDSGCSGGGAWRWIGFGVALLLAILA